MIGEIGIVIYTTNEKKRLQLELACTPGLRKSLSENVTKLALQRDYCYLRRRNVISAHSQAVCAF